MRINPEDYNHITGAIISAAIDVHDHLGVGLMESTYDPCMPYELATRGLRYHVQKSIPIVYRGMPMDTSCRIDLIVEDLVVVEMKSVMAIVPVHQAQLLTYMRLTGCPIGLLINFNTPRLMDGVKRMLNPAAHIEPQNPEP